MYGIFTYIHLVDLYVFHVGTYASPMDPMGYNTVLLLATIAIRCTNREGREGLLGEIAARGSEGFPSPPADKR